MATILVGGQGVPGPIVEIEAETGRHFHFEGTEALPLDTFDVVLEGTREEVEERALPFREGEEVLVHIEEPHMYNDDDAVAKLDGYVVSVSERRRWWASGRWCGSRRWPAARRRRRWSTRRRGRRAVPPPRMTDPRATVTATARDAAAAAGGAGAAGGARRPSRPPASSGPRGY